MHDLSGVGSVGITAYGPLDQYRFNMFMRDLLAEKARDIFRSKGVLCVKVSPCWLFPPSGWLCVSIFPGMCGHCGALLWLIRKWPLTAGPGEDKVCVSRRARNHLLWSGGDALAGRGAAPEPSRFHWPQFATQGEYQASCVFLGTG
jgi:Cobalamin synthesis protein cobW C-terminal domain